MKKPNNLLQQQLIECLSTGAYYPLSLLCTKLHSDEITVAAEIADLEKLGLNFKQSTRHGFQLASAYTPLNYQQITGFNDHLDYDLYLFNSIDSTNRFLKNYHSGLKITFCCAEQQTQGQGRFGRQWASPFGENIYFSARFEFQCSLHSLAGLSLAVSLGVLESLQDRAILADVLIKWPNDLMWHDKKLAGILIESITNEPNRTSVIIGIGININSQQSNALASKPWCSLSQIINRVNIDRNPLIASLINHLTRTVLLFSSAGFSAFQSAWQQYDYLAQKSIIVAQRLNDIQGIAHGVNVRGELCLLDNQGHWHYLSSGETSVSRINQPIKY